MTESQPRTFLASTPANSLLKDQQRQSCEQMCIERSQVQAFIPEVNIQDRLATEAKTLHERFPDISKRPPLFGICLGVKDVFYTDTLATHAGSWLPEQVFSGSQSIAVSQLLNAGALLIGKTTCNEFGYLRTPSTLNPQAPSCSPGGSSCGSAAAVAAGQCDLALGSQSRAGIMLPAAFCGVLGFKPSAGRISKQGMFPFSPSLDQVGMFSRDYETMYKASKVLLLKADSHISARSNIAFGIPHQNYLAQANADVLSYFHALLDLIRKAGYIVKETKCFEDCQELNRFHYELFAAEFTQNHIPLYREYQALYSPSARALFERGMKVPANNTYAARDMQLSARYKAHGQMHEAGVTVLISPATASLPPLLNSEPANRMMSLPYSFCGLPCLSVPQTGHPTGLPFGLQLSCACGGDEFLLESVYPLLASLLTSPKQL